MSLEPKERTIVYGLVAACICGIIIIGAFLLFAGEGFFSSPGFSELFFEEHQKLPVVIDENEPFSFSFVIRSHNKEKMNYFYNVYAGDQKIRSGSFTLPTENKYNKTVIIDDITLGSTLITLNQSETSETQFTYNGGLGLMLSHDGSAPLVVTDPSKLYYPVRLPGSAETATLIFNPDAHETFQTTTTSKTKIGDIRTITIDDMAIEIDGRRISSVGFDTSVSEWTINNDLGIISALSKTTTTRYRYAFERISVDVKASPELNPETESYYEIHFWIIVKNPSEQ